MTLKNSSFLCVPCETMRCSTGCNREPLLHNSVLSCLSQWRLWIISYDFAFVIYCYCARRWVGMNDFEKFNCDLVSLFFFFNKYEKYINLYYNNMRYTSFHLLSATNDVKVAQGQSGLSLRTSHEQFEWWSTSMLQDCAWEFLWLLAMAHLVSPPAWAWHRRCGSRRWPLATRPGGGR